MDVLHGDMLHESPVCIASTGSSRMWRHRSRVIITTDRSLQPQDKENREKKENTMPKEE
jgi:hypothetical protein